MNDTKITRILMNMATVEDGLAKGHEAKAKLLRELAAEIESPNNPSRTENPKPKPNPNNRVEVKADSWEEVEEELGKAVAEWLKRLQSSTARPTSWPF